MATNEELVKRYQSGDYFVLDELTQQNMNLIEFIAYKYSSNSVVDHSDLIQEGWTGFFRAVKSYNGEKDNAAKFSTWAVYWIRQAISRYIRQKTPKNEVSLQQSINEDGSCYEDTLPADEEDTRKMWRRLEVQELHRDLDHLMNEKLSLQQREIVKLRYGWDKQSTLTCEEIGQLYGFTGMRASQINNVALNKLRNTTWARVRDEDYWRETIAKTRYMDPLIALSMKYERRESPGRCHFQKTKSPNTHCAHQ